MINSIKELSNSNWNHTTGAVFDTIPPQAAAAAIEMHRPTAMALIEVPLKPLDYRRVFGHEASASDVGDILKATAQAARSEIFGKGKVTTLIGLDKNAAFADFLSRTSSDYPVIIGHNQNGKFTFLDGTSLSLVLMSKRCGEAKKVCIFISCRSKDYISDGSVGVARDLTMSEGIWLGNKIANWISSRTDPISIMDARSYVKQLDRDIGIKYHVSYVVLAGCVAATGYGVYILVEGAEAPDPGKQ